MDDEQRQRELERDLQALDGPLSRAFRTEAPAGLADRVYEATVEELPSRRPVLARLVRAPAVRMAAAVGALLVLGLAAWVVVNSRPGDSRQIGVDTADIPVTSLKVHLQQVDRAFRQPAEPIDSEIDRLAQEVQRVQLIEDGDDGAMDGSLQAQWADRLVRLERELGAP